LSRNAAMMARWVGLGLESVFFERLKFFLRSFISFPGSLFEPQLSMVYCHRFRSRNKQTESYRLE
jgi:hypothetical protein